MKICITGGGNLSHAITGELAIGSHEIYVLTRKPNEWSDKLEVFHNNVFHHFSHICLSTDNPEILRDMDIVIITVPTNVRYEYLEYIKQYISKNTLLVTAPSVGGINFYLEKLFPFNKFICLQRVPYICRIIKYGYSVNTEIKKEISAYSPNTDVGYLKQILGLEIKPLDSFYTLFLSNSNPILHLAGMCELIKHKDYPFNTNPYFYDIWSDSTSELTLKMDNELAQIMSILQVSDYVPLLEHYNVGNVNELTLKLKSIESFKAILSPLIKIDEKYYIDKSSRYLLEDLPYGTCIIKYIASLLGIATPNIDKVIRMMQPYIGCKFIDNSGILDKALLQNYINVDVLSEMKRIIKKNFYRA